MADVVTGEAVVLAVPCARFPSRLLALALDLLIQMALLFVLGKRLGDLFAGTFVVQQRLPAGRTGAALPAVSPELASWGAAMAWRPPTGAAIHEPPGAATHEPPGAAHQEPTGAAREGEALGHEPPATSAAGGFVPPA